MPEYNSDIEKILCLRAVDSLEKKFDKEWLFWEKERNRENGIALADSQNNRLSMLLKKHGFDIIPHNRRIQCQ